MPARRVTVTRATLVRRPVAATAPVCILLTGLAFTVPTPAAELQLSRLPATPSQIVTSRLTIIDVASLAIESLDIIVTYDPAVLTFVAGRSGSDLMGGPFPPTAPFANDQGGTVFFSGTTLLVGVVPPEGGVLFEIDFQARADAVPGVITTQEQVEVRINETTTFTSTGATPNATAGTVVVGASMPPPVFGATVGKLDATGSDLQIDWTDAGCVGDLDHQIVYGFESQLPAAPGLAYSTSSAACSIGAAPPYAWLASPDPAPGGFVWWLVLATDGVASEGAAGLDSAGSERTGPGLAGSSGECGIGIKSLDNGCTP